MKTTIFILFALMFNTASANTVSDFDKAYWHCSCFSHISREPIASIVIGEDQAEFAYEAEAIANAFCQQVIEKLSTISCKKQFKTF